MNIVDKEADKETDQETNEDLKERTERIYRLKMLSESLKYYGGNSSNPIQYFPLPLDSFGLEYNSDVKDLSLRLDYVTRMMVLMQEQLDALYEVNMDKDVFIESQSKVIAEINEKYRNLNENVFSYINDKENNLTTQYLNVEIYLDTNEPQDIFNAYSAVLDFTESLDFEMFVELDAVKGSWWKKMMVKSTKFLTSEEVTNRLKEAEYALEVQILKSQSEIDKNQSEALSNIMVSLNGVPNAAIRIGSLLVVKNTNESGEVSLLVQTLNLNQLHLLNKNPNLLSQPKNILEHLSIHNDGEVNNTVIN